MKLALDAVSWLLLMGGSAFVVIGGIGMLRFPDAYTRMHAVSLTDTAGAAMIVAGLMLQAGPTLMAVKLAMMLGFLLFTTPAATHAFALTAMRNGLVPVTRDPPAQAPDAP